MKILIIGAGGREHALAQTLCKSLLVSKIIVAPGNPGMSSVDNRIVCHNISVTDIDGLCQFALLEKIDLTIVGPEVSLSHGVVDAFLKTSQLIVGPSKAASCLETSKSFAKKMMKKALVPTALYEEFFDYNSALSFIEETPSQKMVVKCDGLAQGKGVIVCENKLEARNAVKALMQDEILGSNVPHIIIEEYLTGVELSAFALCDGKSFTFLGAACDHKRLRDGDTGPNTGGMGAFSPANCLGKVEELWIEEKIFAPMIQVMNEEGIPFSGILFAGLMKTKEMGLMVLEFNVRLGDPETQVLLPLINEDILPWLLASAKGEIKETQEKLDRKNPLLKNQHAVHVVMAAFGYPGTEGVAVRPGDVISFADDFKLGNSDSLFFAGVDLAGENFVTKGGRVLGVTSLNENIKDARTSAYEKIELIHFEGAQYRHDIGERT